MRKPLADLAARFQRAAAAREAEHVRAQAAQAARRAEAQAARRSLLEDLAAFAQVLGVQGQEAPERVVWVREGREVVFEAIGELDRLSVTWTAREPIEGRIYREEALANRWVLSVGQGQHEVRVPLLEAGVVRLATEGLDLPPPDGDAAAEEEAPLSQERVEGRRL